ncbi:MAG TPA: hypothetical protein DIW30_05605 [Bacteroidales bacterium]|nr:hypothetical protein [Bacteroidales bacterium]
MSDYKCPECGAPMKMGERHCANCDYELTDAEYTAMMAKNIPAQAPDTPTFATGNTPASKQPAAAPESVMAHGNVDVSQHHSEDKSTHNIDNSQTVNNTNQTVTNTFIIMGGGAPLPPNVDPQTVAALEQAQRAQQQMQPTPHVAEPQSVQETYTPSSDEKKGVGAINGSRRPITVEPPRKGLPKWTWFALVLAGVALFLVFRPAGKTDKPIVEEVKVETAQPVKQEMNHVKTQPVKTARKTKPARPAEQTVAKQETETVQPVQPPKANPFTEYKNAADAGDAAAMFKVAKCYQSGDGVSKNINSAFLYMKAAAEAGYTKAYRELAEMYRGGRGIEKDRDLAETWYRKAAAAGDRKAQQALDNM